MPACPRCQSSLATRVIESVEIDECESCGGIWFDANELSQLIGGAEPTLPSEEEQNAKTRDYWGDGQSTAADMETKDTSLLCPKCENAKLTAFIYNGDTGIELDSCEQCLGIWLDSKELDQIKFFVSMGQETNLLHQKAASTEEQRKEALEHKTKHVAKFLYNSIRKKKPSATGFSLFSWKDWR